MTSSGRAENPFSAAAVAPVDGSVATVTVTTPAVQAAIKQLDSYLGSAQGNVIAVVGDYGTGKTHLAALLREQASRVATPSPVVCYLGGLSRLFENYRQVIDGLGPSHVRDLVTSMTDIAVSRDFREALALLGNPQFEESAWTWLTGGQPDQVLRDRGVSAAIDQDIGAVEGIAMLARLHGARGIKFVVLIDDVDDWSDLPDWGPQKLFEEFSASGSLLVLLGRPPFLDRLRLAARERISSVVHMPALTADDVVTLIINTQQARLGVSRLEPFTMESVRAIVAVSRGVVRQVVRLCHRLFEQATAEGTPVNRTMVRQAVADLMYDEPVAQAAEPVPVEKTDVKWFHDAPASADGDLLKRDRLALVLDMHLRRSRAEHPHVSLMVHVDGAWGTGKSTLLRLLGKRLSTAGFLVVEFDAWQQSRLSPPWWALLTTVRNAVVHERRGWSRFWLALKEKAERARRSGAAFLLTLALLVVFAGGTGLLVRAVIGAEQPGSELLKLVASVITAVGVLWTGAKVAARVLLWDSASGARLFEQSGTNPMGRVAEHFDWVLRQSHRPVVLFVDDLDRCKHEYVVELLDAVQTLLRDSPGGRRGRRADSPAAYIVVSADGYWLRKSYTVAYSEFDDDTRPGPLGYQFMDKLFQLTVPMPALSETAQREFLGGLLGVGATPEVAAAVAEARDKVEAAVGDESRVLAALDSIADAGVRNEVAVDAIRALADPETQQHTEHTLRKFAPLLGTNPRETKLFLNTYTMLRDIRILEDDMPETGHLALWSVLRVRWPAVADHLRHDPSAVRGIHEPLWCADHFPEPLRAAAGSEDLRRVVSDPVSGPLTEAAIRACCGSG